MAWFLLDDDLLDPLLRFLGPREAGCVSFTEHLIEEGRPCVPDGSNAAVHVEVGENAEVVAAVMQRPGGVFHPVLSEGRQEFTAGLLARIRHHSRRVYSVMGRTADVLALEELFRRAPLQAVDYVHMVQHDPPQPVPHPRIPDELRIRTATPLDTEHLFDIQRQYEIEEVLLPGNAFNAAASRQHLRETLRRQIVILAEIAGVAVAKAGTNARGLFFDQIGGVFTEPRLRSRGISTVLMTRLLSELARQRKSASLFVKHENQPALRLYRNLGFGEEGGFRISYYR